jgi:hypothetical protein
MLKRRKSFVKWPPNTSTARRASKASRSEWQGSQSGEYLGDLREAQTLWGIGELRFHLRGLRFSDALIRSWSPSRCRSPNLQPPKPKLIVEARRPEKAGIWPGCNRRWPKSLHFTGPTMELRRSTEGLVRGGQRGADFRPDLSLGEKAAGDGSLCRSLLFGTHEIRSAELSK